MDKLWVKLQRYFKEYNKQYYWVCEVQQMVYGFDNGGIINSTASDYKVILKPSNLTCNLRLPKKSYKTIEHVYTELSKRGIPLERMSNLRLERI